MKTILREKKKSVELIVLADRISSDNLYIDQNSGNTVTIDKFYATKELNLCISAGLKNHKEVVKLTAISKKLSNRINKANDAWVELKDAELSAKGLNYGSSLNNMLQDAKIETK